MTTIGEGLLSAGKSISEAIEKKKKLKQQKDFMETFSDDVPESRLDEIMSSPQYKELADQIDLKSQATNDKDTFFDAEGSKKLLRDAAKYDILSKRMVKRDQYENLGKFFSKKTGMSITLEGPGGSKISLGSGTSKIDETLQWKVVKSGKDIYRIKSGTGEKEKIVSGDEEAKIWQTGFMKDTIYKYNPDSGEVTQIMKDGEIVNRVVRDGATKQQVLENAVSTGEEGNDDFDQNYWSSKI